MSKSPAEAVLRDSLEYAAAFDLEVWKAQQQTLFQSQLSAAKQKIEAKIRLKWQREQASVMAQLEKTRQELESAAEQLQAAQADHSRRAELLDARENELEQRRMRLSLRHEEEIQRLEDQLRRDRDHQKLALDTVQAEVRHLKVERNAMKDRWKRSEAGYERLRRRVVKWGAQQTQQSSSSFPANGLSGGLRELLESMEEWSGEWDTEVRGEDPNHYEEEERTQHLTTTSGNFELGPSAEDSQKRWKQRRNSRSSGDQDDQEDHEKPKSQSQRSQNKRGSSRGVPPALWARMQDQLQQLVSQTQSLQRRLVAQAEELEKRNKEKDELVGLLSQREAQAVRAARRCAELEDTLRSKEEAYLEEKRVRLAERERALEIQVVKSQLQQQRSKNSRPHSNYWYYPAPRVPLTSEPAPAFGLLKGNGAGVNWENSSRGALMGAYARRSLYAEEVSPSPFTQLQESQRGVPEEVSRFFLQESEKGGGRAPPQAVRGSEEGREMMKKRKGGGDPSSASFPLNAVGHALSQEKTRTANDVVEMMNHNDLASDNNVEVMKDDSFMSRIRGEAEGDSGILGLIGGLRREVEAKLKEQRLEQQQQQPHITSFPQTTSNKKTKRKVTKDLTASEVECNEKNGSSSLPLHPHPRSPHFLSVSANEKRMKFAYGNERCFDPPPKELAPYYLGTSSAASPSGGFDGISLHDCEPMQHSYSNSHPHVLSQEYRSGAVPVVGLRLPGDVPCLETSYLPYTVAERVPPFSPAVSHCDHARTVSAEKRISAMAAPSKHLMRGAVDDGDRDASGAVSGGVMPPLSPPFSSSSHQRNSSSRSLSAEDAGTHSSLSSAGEERCSADVKNEALGLEQEEVRRLQREQDALNREEAKNSNDFTHENEHSFPPAVGVEPAPSLPPLHPPNRSSTSADDDVNEEELQVLFRPPPSIASSSSSAWRNTTTTTRRKGTGNESATLLANTTRAEDIHGWEGDHLDGERLYPTPSDLLASSRASSAEAVGATRLEMEQFVSQLQLNLQRLTETQVYPPDHPVLVEMREKVALYHAFLNDQQ